MNGQTINTRVGGVEGELRADAKGDEYVPAAPLSPPHYHYTLTDDQVDAALFDSAKDVFGINPLSDHEEMWMLIDLMNLGTPKRLPIARHAFRSAYSLMLKEHPELRPAAAAPEPQQ